MNEITQTLPWATFLKEPSGFVYNTGASKTDRHVTMHQRKDRSRNKLGNSMCKWPAECTIIQCVCTNKEQII